MSTVRPPAKIVFGPDLDGLPMTPEQFDAIEEHHDAYYYELIHGVLVVTLYPGPAERRPNDELGRLLLNYQEQYPQGKVLDDTLNEHYLQTRQNRRRANRVVWIGLGRRPDPIKDLPKIVAEFVSAGARARKRDYEEKREEYADAGVAEYWIIDRFRRTLTVCRPGEPDLVIAENEMYTTPLLPGFELPLARLFALADRWAQDE
jgi:Uma2 family endonuclease